MTREVTNKNTAKELTMTRSMFLSVLFSFSVAACAGLGTGQDDQNSLGASDCDRQASGQTCQVDADCGQGEECEDGVCKLHGGACDGDSDDGSGSGDGSGGQCTTDAQCPSGQECEDGLCKPHGGA